MERLHIIDISACLVRRPQSAKVLDFLESWHLAADPVAVETILIDPIADATSERINDRYKQTIIFETGRRENIPRALNRAMEMAQGRYIMLAAEGLSLDRQGLLTMLAYLDDNPQVGIIGPSLIDANDSSLASAWSFPGLTSLVVGRPFPAPAIKVSATGHNFSPALEVDWLSADCLIMRREILEDITRLDGRYQQAYYDLDLCWRARRLGWHILRMPTCRMRMQGKSIYAAKRSYPADLFRFLAKKHRLLPLLAD